MNTLIWSRRSVVYEPKINLKAQNKETNLQNQELITVAISVLSDWRLSCF